MRFEMAKFKISGVFEITNRGYVLLGEILEGEIASGGLIHFDSNTTLKIKSIEAVRDSHNPSNLGLIVGVIDKIILDQLRGLTGQIILIS